MVPLQALGGVDREQLDGVVPGVGGRQVQTVLLPGRGLEPGEERRDVVGARGGRELHRLVREGVQVAPRGRGILPGQRGQLDVQPEHRLHLVDHGGQLVPEHLPQGLDVREQRPEPTHALRGDAAAPRGHPTVTREGLERLDQAGAVHGIGHHHVAGVLARGGVPGSRGP